MEQICESCMNSEDTNDNEEELFCILLNITVLKKGSCPEHTFKLVFDELPDG
jgi:hypothetical protein